MSDLTEQKLGHFIRQSNLVHYRTCPQKFKLSREFNIEQNDKMREGLLFEFYLLGCKPGMDAAQYEKELIGLKKKPTIDKIKALVEKVRPFIGEGTSFVEYKLERKNGDPLRGEIDRVGQVLYGGEWIRALIDVKKTSNMETIWNRKTKKLEYLQSISYPYLHFKLTGELLPFVYVIVEDTFENDPLIKLVKVNATEEDFNWFESLLADVDNDFFFNPVVSDSTCYSMYGKARCDYYPHCEYAKDFYSQDTEIHFGELE